MGFLATTVNTKVLNRFGIEIRRHRSPAVIQILNYFNFDTVIDVGANIGQFARSILDNGFQGEVFSIEPSSEAFNELVAESKRYQKWHVIPRCALGAFEGEAKLTFQQIHILLLSWTYFRRTQGPHQNLPIFQKNLSDWKL